MTTDIPGPSDDTAYRLHLFGLPCLKDAREDTLNVRGRKSIALLSYLVHTYPQVHSREHLAGLFWPELSDKDARNNLRVSTSRLAKALALSKEPVLNTTRLTVAFNPESSLRCDVTEFQTLVRQARNQPHDTATQHHDYVSLLAQAATDYTAEFMEGFHLDACEAFEDWQLDLREQLRASAVSVFSTLVREAEASGHHAMVEQYAHRWLTVAPYAEDCHRHLMTALALEGDQNAALSHYTLMKTRLQTDLGVAPDETTRALASAIENGKIGRESHVLSTSGSASPDATPANNLPIEKTAYIGNSDAVTNLLSHLKTQRLVTVTGIGGIGKSRLAVQLGRNLGSTYVGGVWLIRLASLSSRTEMLSRLASVLGVQLLPGDEAIRSICNQLDDRRRLLIFDNFEHLLTEKDVVSTLLELSPNVTILVTSRQRLQLAEEATFTLHGLSYARTSKTADANTSGDASDLFQDIATRTLLSFDNDSNRTEIHRIVNLVKGHPLAIVIAASWVDGLSCRQIANELEKGLGILETEHSDIPERQRSIRATFNYSWSLLDENEQQLFAALSLFTGGFNAKAASAVADASFQKLTLLVRKSLLQHYPDQERYEMHELMRQYAEEELLLTGAAKKIAKAHSEHYLRKLSEISSLQLDDNTEQQQAFSDDYNNIRKAWRFALKYGKEEALVEPIRGLRIMCSLGAHSHDLLELLQPAEILISDPAKDPSHRDLTLNILLALGFAHRYTNGYFARELGDIFARAYGLIDELETSPELFAILYGRWSYNFTSGHLLENLSVLQQWRERLTSLQASGELPLYAKDAEFVIHMLEGPQYQCMGELKKGRDFIHAGLHLDNVSRHSAIMGNYGLNFAVSGRHWLAINLCMAGLMDQSTLIIRQAEDIAKQGTNPYLKMFVAFGQLIIAVVRKDADAVGRHARAVNALVEEHRIFKAFRHHADIYSAYALTLKGNHDHLQAMHGLVGSGLGIPLFRLFDVQLFADSLVRTGKPKEAIQYLQTFTDSAENRSIRYSLSESARIQGDAQVAMGKPSSARQCYDRAIAIAESHQAGLYHLRAINALAGHLVARHELVEAKVLLTPAVQELYACEGSIDYTEAQALLSTLPAG